MADNPAVSVPLDRIGIQRKARATVAVVGNPNCGKSTLFNRLTGLRQKTANYPGVTVEKHIGTVRFGEQALELIDLPGTFALSADSMDERIAVDVLLGRMPDMPRPNAILAVLDATRLYQGLYLLQQLAELELPMLVALTMVDAAEVQGISIDIEALGRMLGGVTVVKVVAASGRGLGQLEQALAALPDSAAPQPEAFWPELAAAAAAVQPQLNGGRLTRAEVQRAMIDQHAGAGNSTLVALSESERAALAAAGSALFDGEPALAVEARKRYRWCREVVDQVQITASPAVRLSARVIEFLNRPVPATVAFFLVLMLLFQSVFAWATPLMDMIDGATAWVSTTLAARLPAGALASLLTDGVIAGVGSVIIFLPQILILFLFVILLEDTGYLARAAFLMDRAMRSLGLSGQSVIPMLSSFACAVPGIMATRVIPSRRDRIATILASPFMTCSARLPVYALLIAAFVPATTYGPFNLQGLVLFGLYLLGIAGGAVTALLLRKTALRGPKPSFVLALPEFRVPDLRSVLLKLLDRARIFLRRAGTVIFTVAVIVWALAYFPRSAELEARQLSAHATAEAVLSGPELTQRLATLDNEFAAAHLEQSALGTMGQVVAPVFAPLGWDWRVSAAVIAGFPAREVVVAVLGTIYAVGADADESRLAERLASATWPDGRPVYTLPMVLGLLVFYAWCLQCAATLAVIRRETNTWRWPIFAWTYMTTMGYVGALLIYQLGS